MTTFPGLSLHRSALFLDFDGTLVELAGRPDAVVVPSDLAALLDALQERLEGAFALVTGRSRADLLGLLPALRWPAAFEHGAMRCSVHGIEMAGDASDLTAPIAAAQALASRHHGLLVEIKQTSLALHYRLNPALASACVATLQTAIEHLPGLQLLHGKAVVEVKSVSVGKGLAIEAFMKEAPFAGRLPVFAGDDVTDEAGFETVQHMGGLAIKVGAGPSSAHHRCTNPPALRAWLQQLVEHCA